MHGDVDIIEGGWVYCAKDGVYKEWDKLTDAQQKVFIEARDAVYKAFKALSM